MTRLEQIAAVGQAAAQAAWAMSVARADLVDRLLDEIIAVPGGIELATFCWLSTASRNPDVLAPRGVAPEDQEVAALVATLVAAMGNGDRAGARLLWDTIDDGLKASVSTDALMAAAIVARFGGTS